MIVILGIDPGFCATGYGLVFVNGGLIKYIDSGIITLTSTKANRLITVKQSMEKVILRYSPNYVIVENIISAKNALSTIKLANISGVCIFLAQENNIPVYEYPSTFVKKMITGSGIAQKQDVAAVVNSMLNIKKENDESDALAICICKAKSIIGNIESQ